MPPATPAWAFPTRQITPTRSTSPAPTVDPATEIRLLFAFEPRREAIFLVAGDKTGNWEGWYRQAIPLADERFARHLAELEKEEETGKR